MDSRLLVSLMFHVYNIFNHFAWYESFGLLIDRYIVCLISKGRRLVLVLDGADVQKHGNLV